MATLKKGETRWGKIVVYSQAEMRLWAYHRIDKRKSMAVRKRRRRRIAVNNRLYLWWIQEDKESPNLVLHVVSQDKRFMVQYHLGYPKEICHLIVIGKEFGGRADMGRGWRRFRCPQWEVSETISPGAVRSLIEWGLSTQEDRIEVDWRGQVRLQ